MDENKLIIGHKIRSIRELKGFSQEYISSKINISQNALSKIERGEIKLSFEKSCELAKILETDINTLINFEPGNVFNNCTQSGVLNSYNFTDKSLFEELLETKNKLIKELEMRINMLTNK
jgi:transcriptional regulator with XRE-family HTH domain